MLSSMVGVCTPVGAQALGTANCAVPAFSSYRQVVVHFRSKPRPERLRVCPASWISTLPTLPFSLPPEISRRASLTRWGVVLPGVLMLTVAVIPTMKAPPVIPNVPVMGSSTKMPPPMLTGSMGKSPRAPKCNLVPFPSILRLSSVMAPNPSRT